jgi:hypothetical protein
LVDDDFVLIIAFNSMDDMLDEHDEETEVIDDSVENCCFSFALFLLFACIHSHMSSTYFW